MSIPDDISRLSRKLLATQLAEDGCVFISSSDFRSALEPLLPPLSNAVLEFVNKIRASIPTDFSFSLAFDLEGMSLSMDFDDGNTGSTAGSFFFTSKRSVFQKLRHLEWDKIRADCIEGSKIFEELLSEAEDRPVNIPSSKEAAEANAEMLAETLRQVRASDPLPLFAVVYGREDFGVIAEECLSRGKVVYEIADLMTTQNDILAVLENGVAWSFDEIEAAKLEAVEELGPISRAKAERRFPI